MSQRDHARRVLPGSLLRGFNRVEVLRQLRAVRHERLALVVVGAAVLWWAVRGSLPALDGERALAGLSAPVTVARDANGVPTVKGTTRADVARATRSEEHTSELQSH